MGCECRRYTTTEKNTQKNISQVMTAIYKFLALLKEINNYCQIELSKKSLAKKMYMMADVWSVKRYIQVQIRLSLCWLGASIMLLIWAMKLRTVAHLLGLHVMAYLQVS